MAPKLAVIAKIKEPIQEGDHHYAPDSEVEKSELWTQQVLLPFSIGDFAHAFINPLISPKQASKMSHFFPCQAKLKLWLFFYLIPIGYFDKENRFFRNPPMNTPGYKKRLARVEKAKGPY